MLIEVRRVRIGELAEDELLGVFCAREPHAYCDEAKDRQLAQCLYAWAWWKDASYALPNVTLHSVVDAATDFVLSLVGLEKSNETF